VFARSRCRIASISGVIPLIILIVIVVIVGLLVMSTFNGLVKLRNRVDNAWAQIDVQLKRRYDLIPNLVETVKGYAAHERGTLEAVIQARNMAANAQGPAQQAQAENVLTGALKSLFAVSEAYPDLKANQNFLNLQEELTGTEGRISYARQFYNDTVQKFNTKTQTFPASVIAGMFHFVQREYFEIGEGDRAVPQVSFGASAPSVDMGTPPATPSAPAAPADPGTPPTAPPSV